MRLLFLRILPVVFCLVFEVFTARAGRVILPVKDGPVGNSITALMQDNDGFMWVGTISGLMRYDMYAYRRFGDCDGLPVSRTMIRCLAGDAAGNVWVGTENGVVVYDPVQERFRRIGGRIAAAPVKTVTCSSQGTMLLTTGDGVAVVDPGTLEYRFLESAQNGEQLSNILTTAVDPAGNVWGWSHGRLSRFDFSDDPMSPRIDSWPFDYRIRAMAVDSCGRLWFNDQRSLLMAPLPGEARNSPPPSPRGSDPAEKRD